MRRVDKILRQAQTPHASPSSPKPEDSSRVGVMGGGPAGSFFAYFLLDMAQRVGLHFQVDLYEPRDSLRPGPAGCNMDAGIISESLVQHMAVEGITLASSIVPRGLDSYVLHTDVGSVCIEASRQEKRVASVSRGAGPRGSGELDIVGFDAFCPIMAVEKGTRRFPQGVEEVRRPDDGVRKRCS